MTWRSPEQPWRVPSSVFPAPVAAALAPLAPQHASTACQSRYDERGHRHQPAAQVQAGLPYASRAQ